ncbi:MAG TPA: adenylate/guanylate cyclase domain-containing protein [Candidatus Limnocylindria bacterium]|nr:adenylate/guanylate cyclase domain-containing protein [Candidatus Limnocylindria bacterium]
MISELIRAVGRIGAEPADTADERARRSLLVSIVVFVLPFGAVWGVLYWAADERLAAAIPWTYDAVSILTIAAFGASRSYRLLRTVHLSLILVTPWLLMLALGGITPSSGVVVWSFLSPIGAMALDGPRAARAWMLGFLVLLAVGVPLAPIVRPAPAAMPEGLVQAFAVLNIATVAVIVFLVLAAFAEQRRAAQERLHDLLVNVLPAVIADRLTTSQRGAIADQHPEASVLFADVVDFTPMSRRLPAAQVVGMLDRLFTDFDELVDASGLEKIKTIGDAYMVAAGVPAPRPDHAHALARLGLEMLAVARRHRRDDGTPLELRIGINSGPVVAGVIGRRRFLYDLWGDAVNTASRMESHGAPGEVQVTRATYELVRDAFACEPRGTIEVKGKGPMETWFLRGRRDAAGPG